MSQFPPLTSLTGAGGCGAKIGPGILSRLLEGVTRAAPPELLVGCEASDDAAVYRISGDQVLIQTVDFFPPMVDDPYVFGQVAAANAISDVYAMGGQPRLALNLLAFPCTLPLEAVKAILAGGGDKAAEAGVVIAGGHSIDDREPKYGLSVTGFARPEEVLTNGGAQTGDVLVLTKPLGTGVLTAAARGGLLSPEETAGVAAVMTALNKGARDAMMPLRPHACTDVTGFSLLGHSREMAQASGRTIRIFSRQVPLQPRALELATEGILPAGVYRNRSYLEEAVELSAGVPLALADCLFDPQTSGGLLIALPEGQAETLLSRLADAGASGAVVGRVEDRGDRWVTVE